MWAEDTDRLIARARAATANPGVASMLAEHLDLSPAQRAEALERLSDTGDQKERQEAMERQRGTPSREASLRSMERAVVLGAEISAAVLESVAKERRLEWVNERDHQSKAVHRALAGSSNITGVTLDGARRVKWPDHWPRVGDIDLIIRTGELRAAIELKCGAGKDALAACVWDAVKLATALSLGDVHAAYLVAAAPAPRFVIGTRGPDDIPTCAEFFTAPSTWGTADVRQTYRTWFDQWQRNQDPLPVLVPATFSTRLVSTHHFSVDDAPWQQRVSRVELTDESWYPWIDA